MTPLEPVALLSEDWLFVLRNTDYLLFGLLWTLALTATSLTLGFLLGFPAGLVEVYGGRYSKTAVENVGVVLRGTPILVIIMVTYFGVGLSPAFVAATIALGLRSAAYQAQVFRGSIQSVSSGQLEAARAIGMSKWDGIRRVVVPQALRRSFPGFQNEFTIILKDTSIAFAIGLAELLTRSYDLFVQRTTAVLEVILFVSLLYFIVTFSTNRLLDYLEGYVAIPGGGR